MEATDSYNNPIIKSDDVRVPVSQKEIEQLILNIRDVPVILDRDIAALYGVETRRINEQVKRNKERFPEDFMFQLSEQEFSDWKSQNATSKSIVMGARRKPYAFTETGVAMLSSVLKSEKAISVNIMIMRAFVAMRHYWVQNTYMLQRLETIEHHQLCLQQHQNETDKRIDDLLNRLDNSSQRIVECLFFEGQIFDAYTLISDLVRAAKKRIVLIDNYVNDKVLKTLDKRAVDVNATIYTDPRKSHITLDLARHNAQYPPIYIHDCRNAHDRFLIIDDTVYLIGGSIKDLGKRIVAISQLHQSPDDIFTHLR